MCACGQCTNSLVAVDGRPGVRACGEPARDGHGASTHQNAWPSLELRRDAGDRPLRRPVHAARLLLQDLHPPAEAVAGLREGPPPRRRPRACCASSRTTASGAPSTAAATATCSSSAAGSPASRPRRAPRSRAPTSCSATRTPSRAARCSPRAATSAPARSPSRPAWRASRSSRARPRSGFFDGLVPVWQGDTLHQVRARAHGRRDRRDRAAARLRRQRPARA